MTHPPQKAAEPPTEPPTERGSLAHRAVFASTLLFVLVAVGVSTGLVIYTAYLHDPNNGLFALLFAVLSARAALSWCLWHSSWLADSWSARQPVNSAADQQEGRKPTDETPR